MGAARSTLVDEGVERVRVAVLAERLGVARSSFYWYFRDRGALLETLVDTWAAHNVAPLVERAARPAPTVTAAVLAVFECWADPDLFDAPLEFAIRDWARRDVGVREQLDAADTARIEALAALHRRFGAGRREAEVRARVHYHSQIGLYALGVRESHAERLRLVAAYVETFCGVAASDAELRAFSRYVAGLGRRRRPG